MSFTDASEPQPPKGLRERNKEDKLQRIRKAARDLFEEKGYEGTTIRDVAKRADVGQGTVTFYASEKRELVFLVVNEDHVSLQHRAFKPVDPDGSLLEQLHEVFAEALRFVVDQGAMGRFMLRELTFDSADEVPPQEALFNRSRLRFMAAIEQLIERAKTRGEVRGAVDTTLAARVIFAVYRSEARIHVSRSTPDLDSGLLALSRSLSVVFQGLSA